MTFEPDPNVNGPDRFKIAVADTGFPTNTLANTLSSSEVTVGITVTAVNDPPTLAGISNRAAIQEDAGLQTVDLSGISAGGGESQAGLLVLGSAR